MSTDSLQVVWLGDTGHHEARSVLAALQHAVAAGHMKRAATAREALLLVASEHFYPDLAVVFQSWPDEYSRADVERLIGTLPLARWVCCFGAWCESEGRNRSNWPLAVRVPARCATTRIHAELQVLANSRRALPPTGSRDEIFAFERTEFTDTGAVASAALVKIAVVSPDRAFREYQSDLLRVAGWQVVDSRFVGEAKIVVWDGDPCNDELEFRLRSFSQQYPQTQLILMMAIAHPELQQWGEDLGAGRVLPKLSPASMLLDAISELAPRFNPA